MALKLPKFNNFSNLDAKSRVFVILGGLVGFIVLTYIVMKIFTGDDSATGRSQVAAPPSNLQSVPGGQLTPEYSRALIQANQTSAQLAQISGTSAVPTLMNFQSPTATAQNGTCPNCCTDCTGETELTQSINDLIAQSKLSQDDANHLLDLAKKNVPVSEYAAYLDQLVKEGKLTPEQARKLLEQYKKMHKEALANDSAKSMDALIKSGSLPIDAANTLLDAQQQGMSTADYAAKLQELVRQGKISPAVAQRLLAQYTQQRAQQAAKDGAAQLSAMVQGKQISPDVADDLADLQKRNVSPDDYAAELQRLVKAGKLTPEQAARLLAQYKAQHAARAGSVDQLSASADKKKRDLAKTLQNLQQGKASSTDYANALADAVKQGVLTPEDAAKYLQEFQAANTDIALPNIPTSTNPDFAKLQQRVASAPPEASAVINTSDAGEFTREAQQAALQADKAQQAQVQQLASAMAGQAGQLISTAWAPPTQQVQSAPSTGTDAQTDAASATAKAGTGSDDKTKPTGPPLIKAGAILFATLDTGVDSDYPDSPVMATIITGDLKGAKLLGKLNVASGKDKVGLNFTLMNKDEWPSGKTINAFAIDPDTARSVMASSVDHHYFVRYGSLMASAFLNGYANAVTSSGATKTDTVFGSQVTYSNLSPADKVIAGFGQVGNALSNATSQYFNTPPTVKVNSGVSLGILFMSDVTR